MFFFFCFVIFTLGFFLLGSYVGWYSELYIMWCPDWLYSAAETIGPYIPFILKYFYFPLLTLLGIQALWRFFNYAKMDLNSKLPIPPGSFGLPFVGETITFFIQGADFFRWRYLKHGKMFTTHLLGQPTIRVIGGDLVAKMLQYEPRLVEVRWPTSARCFLGSGCLANTTGQLHRQHKQILLKAFSPIALDLYVARSQPIIVSTLLGWCTEGHILTYKKCRELTFHLASEILLGFQMSLEERTKMLDDFQVFVDNVFCFPHNIPFFGFRKGMKARKRLLEQIVIMLNRGVAPDHQDMGLTARYLTEIAEISDGQFGREELCNSALELLFAGHETLSSATSTLIEHLGQRPDIVEKIRNELDSYDLLTDTGSDADLTNSGLRRLHYLENVIREVLRLQPPVGAGLRVVKKTFELGGYQIPKGWSLAYSIRETQDAWSEENEFDTFNPDRWDELDSSALKQCAHNYFPFGLGVRSCLGRNYARMVLKLLAIEVVRLCDVHVETKQRTYHYLPSPYPTDFLPATFTRRFQKPSVRSVCTSV